MSKTLFLFDIDGTILLTGGAGRDAFNEVFLELYQENYIWDNIKPDGRTDESIIEELFQKRFQRIPEAHELIQVIQSYEIAMSKAIPLSERFCVLPHAIETIENLSRHPEALLGLATGNLESTAYQKLKHAKVDHHFQFGGFGSDARERVDLTRKAFERALEHLGTKPLQTFVIGDTIHDISCGKAIGAKTIGVCTGSTSFEELEKSGADFILKDLGEFESKIKWE